GSQHGVARRLAPKRVRARVIRAVVRLNLGDTQRDRALGRVDREDAAEQHRCNLDRGRRERLDEVQRSSAPDNARTRSTSAARCAATRTAAVPPTPSRLATEPSTVSDSRTSGPRCGEMLAY